MVEAVDAAATSAETATAETTADPEVAETEVAPVAPTRPSLVKFRPSVTAAIVPTPDSYSLRLVLSRTLYDDGVHTQNSPSLAKLARQSGIRLNPGEVERHGLHNGGSVKVLSQTGDLITTVIADDRVPRGVAHFFHNQSGVSVSSLMDQAAMRADGITKVRLETVGG